MRCWVPAATCPLVVLMLVGCTADIKNDLSKLRAEVTKLQEQATAQQAELQELRGQLAAKTAGLNAIVERLSELEQRPIPQPSAGNAAGTEKRLAKLESRFDGETLEIGTIKAKTVAVMNPDGQCVILLSHEEDDESGAGGRLLMVTPDEQSEVRLRCTTKRSFATIKHADRRSTLGCDDEMSVFTMKRGERSQFLVSQVGDSSVDVATAKAGGALLPLAR